MLWGGSKFDLCEMACYKVENIWWPRTGMNIE